MQQQYSQNRPTKTIETKYTRIMFKKHNHTRTNTHTQGCTDADGVTGEARHGGGKVSHKSGFKSLRERKRNREERTDFSSDQAVY